MANKAPSAEGQQQANGEKKEAPAVPSAPPSYEEATSGEGLKAGAFPAAPPAVPLHPSWAYVDPSKSLGSWRLERQAEWWAHMEERGGGDEETAQKHALHGCCMRLWSHSAFRGLV